MGKHFGIVDLLFLGGLLRLLCLDAAKDVCFWEIFNASCSTDEVVFIESAFYGRMRNNKCFNLTANEPNCSKDVQFLLQTRFRSKQSAAFNLASELFTTLKLSCLQGRMPFLEISHQCKESNSNEVCFEETFNATCPTGTVIRIQSALYGRMRSSRCIDFDNRDINCSANVQPYLESLCNRRNGCSIRASTDTLIHVDSSCPKHLKPYLEVFYACVRATETWIIEAQKSRATSVTTIETLAFTDANGHGYTNFTKEMMIIVSPAIAVGLLIISLVIVTAIICKRRQRNRQRKRSCYVDIDEDLVQSGTSTRRGQDLLGEPPRNNSTISPYEPVLSPSNQSRRLPPDPHIYTELLPENKSETQLISCATVNLPLEPLKSHLRKVESTASPIIQHNHLPPDLHIYTELLPEDEPENQPFNGATTSGATLL